MKFYNKQQQVDQFAFFCSQNNNFSAEEKRRGRINHKHSRYSSSGSRRLYSTTVLPLVYEVILLVVVCKLLYSASSDIPLGIFFK